MNWLVGFWILIALGHICGAMVWAQDNKRTGWEAWALCVALVFLWPFFSIRMMCRGYYYYLEIDKQ